jgi:hypothetical protein
MRGSTVEEFDMGKFLENPKDKVAPEVEPAIEMLNAAKQMIELFVALQRAGFNEAQALFVIAEAMKSGGNQ